MLFTCEKVGVSMMPMKLAPREFDWMHSKYGQNVRPWQIAFEFNNQSEDDLQTNMNYSYTLQSFSSDFEPVNEREPRRIVLQPATMYRG